MTAQVRCATAVDRNGLMWANTVGVDLTWSHTDAAGSAQAWVATLNARDYGGYNDRTLATGNGSSGANTMTNQLGELISTDCGNSLGTASVLNHAGKNCTALSTVNGTMRSNPLGALFFSSSLYGTKCCNIYNTYWWMYQTGGSNQGAWNYDTSFGTLVGRGDALAVRRVSAPEVDPASAVSALALLLGSLLALRSRASREREL